METLTEIIARRLGYAAGLAVKGVAKLAALRRVPTARTLGASDQRIVRAVRRVTLSGLGLLPFGYAWLWRLGHPRAADRDLWLLFAAAAVAVFVLVLRNLGGGHGIVWGFWLWLLSLGWLAGIAAVLFSVIVFAGMTISVVMARDPPGVGDALPFVAMLGVGGLLLRCGAWLERAEARER